VPEIGPDRVAIDPAKAAEEIVPDRVVIGPAAVATDVAGGDREKAVAVAGVGIAVADAIGTADLGGLRQLHLQFSHG
jgi:hypothetical protein